MMYILQTEHSGHTLFWTCKDKQDFINKVSKTQHFETYDEALEAQDRNYRSTEVWGSVEEAWAERKDIPSKHWQDMLDDLPHEVFLSEFKFVQTVEEPEEIHEAGDRTGYCEYRNPDNNWIKVCWYVNQTDGFSVQYCDSEYRVDGLEEHFEADVKARIVGEQE